MIFDQENIFYDNNLDDNNVIANIGGGDAHDPLFLAVVANTALSGDATATLETAADEDFTEDVATLGTYTLAGSALGLLVRAKVPYGAKEYLRLSLSGASGGAITAGLVENVPNWP